MHADDPERLLAPEPRSGRPRAESGQGALTAMTIRACSVSLAWTTRRDAWARGLVSSRPREVRRFGRVSTPGNWLPDGAAAELAPWVGVEGARLRPSAPAIRSVPWLGRGDLPSAHRAWRLRPVPAARLGSWITRPECVLRREPANCIRETAADRVTRSHLQRPTHATYWTACRGAGTARDAAQLAVAAENS